jgi:hypothetical protein
LPIRTAPTNPPLPRRVKRTVYGLIGDSAIIAPTGEIAARALGEDDEVITTRLITQRNGAKLEV